MGWCVVWLWWSGRRWFDSDDKDDNGDDSDADDGGDDDGHLA